MQCLERLALPSWRTGSSADCSPWDALAPMLAKRQLRHRILFTFLLGTTDSASPLQALSGSHLLEHIWSYAGPAFDQPRLVRGDTGLEWREWGDAGPLIICLCNDGEQDQGWAVVAKVLVASGLRVAVIQAGHDSVGLDRTSSGSVDPHALGYSQAASILQHYNESDFCGVMARSQWAVSAGAMAAHTPQGPVVSEDKSMVQRMVVLEPVGSWGEMHTTHPYIRCPTLVCYPREPPSEMSTTVWRHMTSYHPKSAILIDDQVLSSVPDQLLQFLIPRQPQPEKSCVLM